MDKRCAQCWFSRVVVSENGLHHVCCFSQKTAIRCMTGEIDMFKGIYGERRTDNE